MMAALVRSCSRCHTGSTELERPILLSDMPIPLFVLDEGQPCTDLENVVPYFAKAEG